MYLGLEKTDKIDWARGFYLFGILAVFSSGIIELIGMITALEPLLYVGFVAFYQGFL